MSIFRQLALGVVRTAGRARLQLSRRDFAKKVPFSGLSYIESFVNVRRGWGGQAARAGA